MKIKSTSPNVTSYAGSVTGAGTEKIAVGVNSNAVQSATIGLVGAGYTSTSGDQFQIKVYDAGLTGGVEIVTPSPVSGGATLSQIATSIASAITNDTNLQALGVSASSAGPVVSIKSTSSNLTTYSGSVTPTTVLGTETIAFGTNTAGNITATVGGTATQNDVVSLTVRAAALPGGRSQLHIRSPHLARVCPPSSRFGKCDRWRY